MALLYLPICSQSHIVIIVRTYLLSMCRLNAWLVGFILCSLCSPCAEESRNSVLVEDFPRYVKSMHANTDHLYSEEYEVTPQLIAIPS